MHDFGSTKITGKKIKVKFWKEKNSKIRRTSISRKDVLGEGGNYCIWAYLSSIQYVFVCSSIGLLPVHLKWTWINNSGSLKLIFGVKQCMFDKSKVSGEFLKSKYECQSTSTFSFETSLQWYACFHWHTIECAFQTLKCQLMCGFFSSQVTLHVKF